MNNLENCKNLILEKVNLASLIAERLELTGRGARKTACCPFHGENTPSFYVFSDHYHCFGCGVHGDAISWVREQYHLGFMESLKWLGEKYGIEVPSFSGPGQEVTSWKQKQTHHLIRQKAHEFFIKQLFDPRQEAILLSLEQRGISKENAKKFQLGYALPNRAQLYQYLKEQNFYAEDIEACSLASLVDGKIYDFFRDRIIIPVYNPMGQVIAFGGRACSTTTNQKYKNSRYDKGRVLYGLEYAEEFMKKKGRVFVVEGYLDTIQMRIHGFGETVACQGTAFTEHHLQLLGRFNVKIYFMFDGDFAGIEATLKLVDLALSNPQLEYMVVALPKAQDPDSFLRMNGTKELESLVEKAESLMDYALFKFLEDKEGLGQLAVLQNNVLPWVAQISNPLARNFFLNKVSEKTQIPTSLLSQYMITQKQESLKKTIKKEELVPVKNLEETPSKDELEVLNPAYLLDFLGILYFSSPRQIDLSWIHSFIKEVQFPEKHERFLKELITLFENEKAPHEVPVSQFESAYFLEIQSLLKDLKQRRAAFEMENPSDQIRKLQLFHRQNKIKSTLKNLRIQASSLKSGDILAASNFKEIAEQISKLNLELNNLEQDAT